MVRHVRRNASTSTNDDDDDDGRRLTAAERDRDHVYRVRATQNIILDNSISDSFLCRILFDMCVVCRVCRVCARQSAQIQSSHIQFWAWISRKSAFADADGGDLVRCGNNGSEMGKCQNVIQFDSWRITTIVSLCVQFTLITNSQLYGDGGWRMRVFRWHRMRKWRWVVCSCWCTTHGDNDFRLTTSDDIQLPFCCHHKMVNRIRVDRSSVHTPHRHKTSFVQRKWNWEFIVLGRLCVSVC